MEQNLKLTLDDEPLFSDPSSYYRLVGRLIYLTITRPEITFSVNILSQFMHTLRQSHMDAAFRALQYLKLNPGKGILMPSPNNLQLLTFSDSNWACHDPAPDHLILSGDGQLSTGSLFNQSTVSRSSAKAKYSAMTSTTCELIWLKYLLQDIGVSHFMLMLLYRDNQAALHIASNPVFHERTKHIELDCHVVRAKLLEGIIQTQYLRTSQQRADIFTKPLRKEQFTFLQSKLGVTDLHTPT
ncbi:hypothetical protein AMTRI_Chr06g197400 [Amborella trichopoda]